jgi:hypothetical protein
MLGGQMTNETRVFVEPADLLGVEFECGHCHARFLYDLSKTVTRVISSCPNCNEAFHDGKKATDFQDFFALLSGMKKLTEGSKMKLRIQVNTPTGK